jgi:hypothetical protein
LCSTEEGRQIADHFMSALADYARAIADDDRIIAVTPQDVDFQASPVRRDRRSTSHGCLRLVA